MPMRPFSTRRLSTGAPAHRPSSSRPSTPRTTTIGDFAIRRGLLAASAFALTVAFALPALAFSRIDPGSGSSDSREGIIAVPLPPLPSQDAPASPQPDTVPGATPGDSAEPEGTDSEEVPISPEDEDILRQRREPGRGDTVDDSAPLRDGRGPLDGAAGGANSRGVKPVTTGPNNAAPATTGTVKTPGAAKPFTAPASSPGSGLSADPGDEAGTAGTPERGKALAPVVPLPSQIAYGDDGLPTSVRDLRSKLIEIAKSGDIERLRPYLQGGEDATVLSFGDTPDDPIAFLKEASGDGQGVEMLAILLEVLQAGHAHVEPGDTDEIYVWPYFTQVQIDTLTRPQMVQLFELVTAGDYEAMKAFGAYNFFRVGISPDGKLEFFVAGD